MNRWARRSRSRLEAALADGETLLAACRVSLVGGVDLARRLGLPAPARLFVLGITDRRMLMWRTTTWLAAPGAESGSVPLSRVAAMRATWRLGPRRLLILFESGETVSVNPMWGGHLRDLEAAFSRARPHQS